MYEVKEIIECNEGHHLFISSRFGKVFFITTTYSRETRCLHLLSVAGVSPH